LMCSTVVPSVTEHVPFDDIRGLFSFQPAIQRGLSLHIFQSYFPKKIKVLAACLLIELLVKTVIGRQMPVPGWLF